MATATQPSSLEALPLELLTQISNHLALPDLRRFRMACRTTAEAVFERMVASMPRTLTVHGKRRASVMDLAYLGATFKMKAAVTRLVVAQLRAEFSGLLDGVTLPGLVGLEVRDGVLEGGRGLVELVMRHKGSLRELRVKNVKFVVAEEVMTRRETEGWRAVALYLDDPASGLQLRERVLEELGYCSPDGTVERWLVRRRKRAGRHSEGEVLYILSRGRQRLMGS